MNKPDHGHVSIHPGVPLNFPDYKWEMRISELRVPTVTAPNIFHCWTQRIFLAITYTRIKP